MNSYPNSTDITREILSRIMIGMLLLFCAILLFANSNIASRAADATLIPTLLPYFATPTPQPACPPSCEYLTKTGGTHFILKLKFPYQKEATLTPEQIKEQRAKIREMQAELRKVIRPKKSKDDLAYGYVFIAYEAVPYILFSGNDELLLLLEKHPSVERIFVDSPLNEAFGMGLDAVPEITGEMLDAADGKPLPARVPQKETDRCLPSCGALIDRARIQGKVSIWVLFKLPRDFEASRESEFESLQNAQMRQIIYKFMLIIQDQRLVLDSGASPLMRFAYLETDAQGVEAILKLPIVEHVVDLAQIKNTFRDPITPTPIH